MDNKIRFAEAETIIKRHYENARPELLQNHIKAVGEMWEYYNCVEMAQKEFYDRWNEWINK
jgi:hypothetical protein